MAFQHQHTDIVDISTSVHWCNGHFDINILSWWTFQHQYTDVVDISTSIQWGNEVYWCRNSTFQHQYNEVMKCTDVEMSVHYDVEATGLE